MSLIGLDIGTTGCKVIVFNESGDILAQASREYPVLCPHPDWAEQDAELVFDLAMRALAEAISKTSNAPPAAMAMACQGEAVIPVDGKGSALRHAILGMDTRTGRENAWLEQKLGASELFRKTGMPLHTVNTLPKLLWLKDHETEIWKKADQFLLYEGFFIRRLTGKAVTSSCLASRTQMYDLRLNDWSEDILDTCGIEKGRLSRLSPDDNFCGIIQDEVSSKYGIPRNLKIFSGGHDQACAALGSGVIQPGMAMVSTGTAEVVEVAMDTPILHPSLREGNISIYRHVVPGLFLAMTLNHSGGMSLRWFRDTFAEHWKDKAERIGIDTYDLLLRSAGDGPTDLLVMPHFSGSGTPLLDTGSSGAILGLSFATGAGDVARAILEGLCFELKLNIDLLRKAGIEVSEVSAVGGGAKSPLWLQLKADICDMVLNVPSSTESACRGAAMLAGIGTGTFPDPVSAADQWIIFSKSYTPNSENRRRYLRRFELYKKLYPLLKETHHSLKAAL